MLKINLLPSYIYQGRKVKKAAVLFGLIFLLVTTAMVSWTVTINSKVKKLEQEVADMEQRKAMVEAILADAEAAEAKAPGIAAKVNFIKDLEKYNLKAPAFYEEMAKYTYSRVYYSNVRLSSNQVSMDAHAKTLGDVGRYLLNIYRARHLFSSVSINGAVPGFPGGENALNSPVSFTITCGLKNSIVAPSYKKGGQPSGARGPAGRTAGPPGLMMPGGPGMPGGPPGAGGGPPRR